MRSFSEAPFPTEKKPKTNACDEGNPELEKWRRRSTEEREGFSAVGLLIFTGNLHKMAATMAHANRRHSLVLSLE